MYNSRHKKIIDKKIMLPKNMIVNKQLFIHFTKRFQVCKCSASSHVATSKLIPFHKMQNLRKKRERTHAQRLECFKDFVKADFDNEINDKNATQRRRDIPKTPRKIAGVDGDIKKLSKSLNQFSMDSENRFQIEEKKSLKGPPTSPPKIKKKVPNRKSLATKSFINDRLWAIRLNADNRNELVPSNLPVMKDKLVPTNTKLNIMNRMLTSTDPQSKLVATKTLLKNPVQQIHHRFLSTKSDVISNSSQSVSDKTEKILDNNFSATDLPALKDCKIEIHSDDDNIKLHVLQKFPMPKSVLHNYYRILSGEFNDKSLIVEPLYKSSHLKKRSMVWTCTYNLKWPVITKITAESTTKKKASCIAASKALEFLLDQGKISSDGLPIVYTKEDARKLTKQKQTVIQLDSTTVKILHNIIQIYNNKMKCLVESVDYKSYLMDCSNNVFGEEQESVLTKMPQFLGVSKYYTKEKDVLPISAYKDKFIDLLQNSKCVIVKGEPGCGKSSRVPQYVLESWIKGDSASDQLCRIAVTQPRRIAAISLADRVAYERNEEVGHIVGYQVRLKSSFQPKTGRILYCTTGILLRYLQSDPSLSRFSHVILDEAHERDVNTDLLMNLLKRALKDNSNLKVIVMSATIDADTFSDYFDGAPVLNIPGFTYPVKRHFLEQMDVDCSKTMKMSKSGIPSVFHDDVVGVIRFIHKNKSEGAILVFLPGWEDLAKVQKLIPPRGDLVVHLVHSKLKDSEQYKIFSKPPPGVRKIILATNIAETSITIDDVVYVVDTGIHKDNVFDIDKGINVIDMKWISKASANQRAGRAGRCSPGESFHLYSQERYEQMPEYSAPKILNTSLTKVVLDSKAYANNMVAEEFMDRLITPPERAAVKRAVDELKELELLDEIEHLTPLGRTLANFQVEPNLAKALVNGVIFKCVTPIVDIVTLFSSETEIFGSSVLTDKDSVKEVKKKFCKTSDHLALMRVFEKWLELVEEEGQHVAARFCRDTNLVPYKLEFVNKLKDVHSGYLDDGLYKSLEVSDQFSDNDELVKAVLYSATGTVLRHRNWDIVKNRLKSNINVLVTRNNHKATITSQSVNYKRRKYPSDYLLYINETHSNIRRTTIVRECSLIPAISVLLFNNRELELVQADPAESQSDMVILGIKNTRLQFLCDKEQANVLISCKQAIKSSYKYLVHQLTYAGEDIPDFSIYWDEILRNLDAVLYRYKIE